MSESFETILSRVNYGKYIDEIQSELEKAIAEVGPAKTPKDVERIQERLQAVIRRQSLQLAKEVGFRGNHVMVFMTATSILATAWVSFALRRETLDLTKSPEDRLATIEMLDALESALGRVIGAAGEYAERYQPTAPGGPAAEKKDEEPQ
jgi:hypothetical protein